MNSDLVVCREQYGSQPVKRRYIQTGPSGARGLIGVDDSTRLSSFSQFFRSVFLPAGYPESVSEDYTQYQVWDTVQAFASSITSTLATQAILKGVGVGDENATVLAATMTWLMKSGTGMMGQIMFTWKQGTYLDCDCKRWRLFADILNDLAIFLDLMAPYFKDYFTLIVCVAGVFRSVVGVAGGATRAALTQHQARRNNMADVSAKDGSQETMVNLLGLVCNLLLVPQVTGKPVLIWMLYIIFTILHLFANYRAVTVVTMETFNQTRLHFVAQDYLCSCDGDILPVKAANHREPVLWKLQRKLNIKLGTSMSHLINSFNEFQKLSSIFCGSKYLLNIDLKKGVIAIALHEEAIVYDQLAACFHAEVLEFALRNASVSGHLGTVHTLHMDNLLEAARHGDSISMVAHSFKVTTALFPSFLGLAQSEGWTTAHALLGADEWRASWDIHGVSDKSD